MKKILATAILFLTLPAIGQNSMEKSKWLPAINSSLPSRFLTVRFDGLFDFGIHSNSTLQEIGNGSSEIKATRLGSVNLRFPVMNARGFILTGAFYYHDEQFYFENQNQLDYPLFVSLNNRNLKKLGSDFNVVIHLEENKSLILRGSIALSGDFYRDYSRFPLSKYMKLSLAAAYSIKKDNNNLIAAGIYGGYTFGTPSVYPVFAWSKRFAGGYGFDAILPQSIKAWKFVGEKTIICSEVKISGESYTIHLDDSVLSGIESLQLRESCLVFSGGVKRHLCGWLWAEVNAGLSKFINFNLSESNFSKASTLPKPDTNYLIKSKLRGAPLASFSLFLSPPEKFLGKIRN